MPEFFNDSIPSQMAVAVHSFPGVRHESLLYCPGGHAHARSRAQRTHRAAKNAAQMPALCYGPS